MSYIIRAYKAGYKAGNSVFYLGRKPHGKMLTIAACVAWDIGFKEGEEALYKQFFRGNVT